MDDFGWFHANSQSFWTQYVSSFSFPPATDTSSDFFKSKKAKLVILSTKSHSTWFPHWTHALVEAVRGMRSTFKVVEPRFCKTYVGVKGTTPLEAPGFSILKGQESHFEGAMFSYHLKWHLLFIYTFFKTYKLFVAFGQRDLPIFPEWLICPEWLTKVGACPSPFARTPLDWGLLLFCDTGSFVGTYQGAVWFGQ